MASSPLAKADDQSNTPSDPVNGVLQPMLASVVFSPEAMAQLKANAYPMGDPSGSAYDRDWDDM